jgi:hypothetical protein
MVGKGRTRSGNPAYFLDAIVLCVQVALTKAKIPEVKLDLFVDCRELQTSLGRQSPSLGARRLVVECG